LQVHAETKAKKRDALQADLLRAGAGPERKQKLRKLEQKAAEQQWSIARNARESRFLDVQGGQVLLWLPDAASAETVGVC